MRPAARRWWGFITGYVVETLRSVNNPGTLLQGNHFHFDKVIDSPLIDFFISPLPICSIAWLGTRCIRPANGFDPAA